MNFLVQYFNILRIILNMEGVGGGFESYQPMYYTKSYLKIGKFQQTERIHKVWNYGFVTKHGFLGPFSLNKLALHFNMRLSGNLMGP